MRARMGKILATSLVALLSVAWAPQGGAVQQDPVYTITIKPNPLRKGGVAEAKYDGPVGTVLTFDWGGETTTGTVDANGKVTFTVPQSATGLLASDPWGNTEAASVSP